MDALHSWLQIAVRPFVLTRLWALQLHEVSLFLFVMRSHNYDDNIQPCCLSSLHCNSCIQKRIDGSDCFFENPLPVSLSIIQASVAMSTLTSGACSGFQAQWFNYRIGRSIAAFSLMILFLKPSAVLLYKLQSEVNETWKIFNVIQSSIKQAVMLSSFAFCSAFSCCSDIFTPYGQLINE